MSEGVFLHAAKNLKHRGFVATKITRRYLVPKWYRLKDRLLILKYGNRPFVFRAQDYSGEFVAWPTHEESTPAPLPNSIFLIWLGGQPLTVNRQRSLEVVSRLNPNLHVILIDDQNLTEYIRDDHPLHSAFENLALTHKSDYLRAYLMHYYGGGYLDVKTISKSWEPAMQRLAQNDEAWVLGYRELSHADATDLPGKMQEQVRRNFFRIVGNSAFVCKPQSPITRSWLAEVERRLAYFEAPLMLRPGGIRGGETADDVVPKHALLASVFGPLNLKFHEHLIIDDSIAPDFTDYL